MSAKCSQCKREKLGNTPAFVQHLLTAAHPYHNSNTFVMMNDDRLLL